MKEKDAVLIKPYFKLLRTSQYLKNLFVLAPLFFSFEFFDYQRLMTSLGVTLAFCFLSSSVYILNDWKDRFEDQHHPRKKARPIASGQVSPQIALSLALVLAIISLLMAGFLHTHTLLPMSLYAFLNLLYSLGIRRITLIDISIIASGFVLRVITGSLAAQVPASQWIIIMTFLLALFIALGKRRDDVLAKGQKNQERRQSVSGYNLAFIDSSMVLMGGVIIVSYLNYTLSPLIIERFHSQHVYGTCLWVVLGILRFLQLTLVYQKSGNPTQLVYKDRILQLILVLWVSHFGLLYGLGQ